MNNMRKNGTNKPEKALHTLRTNFANKISNDVAEMRPDIFCRTYASRIEKATKMNLEDVRKWAATPYKNYPVSKPMCVAKKVALK